jgi:hypothetical protein
MHDSLAFLDIISIMHLVIPFIVIIVVIVLISIGDIQTATSYRVSTFCFFCAIWALTGWICRAKNPDALVVMVFVCCLPFLVPIDATCIRIKRVLVTVVGQLCTLIRQLHVPTFQFDERLYHALSLSGCLVRTARQCSKAITYDRIFIVHAVSYAAFSWYLLWHLTNAQSTTFVHYSELSMYKSRVILAMVYFFIGFCILVWSFEKKLHACHRMQNEALARVHQKLKTCQHELSLAVRQCRCSPSCAVASHRHGSSTADGLSGLLPCGDMTMCATGQLRP